MDAKTPLFPSAFDVAAPKGAEDWKSLYPYYTQFQPSRRKEDDQKFWFCNSQHWPTPLRPFDVIFLDFAIKCLGQYNSRHLLVPPANGIDYRILNGFVYFSPVAVAPEDIEARIPQFMDRAGHYFMNWNELLANWKTKVMDMIAQMNAITFPALPDVVPVDWVKGGIGLDNTNVLFDGYDKLVELSYKTWQYHFEFLNLGYAAYLDFFGFVKSQFPTIPDQAIAKMVQGVDSELFRPDDELKKLARLAVELGVDGALMSGSVSDALAAVGKLAKGAQWLAAWEAAKDPWFNFTSGNGFYSTDKYWIDHLDIPLSYLRDYIPRVKAGERIERPTERLLAERDRITAEYREMMDDEAQAVFDGKLGLSRTVFPYVEDHNFYIEHWALGVFWRKMRELSRLLQGAGFWPDEELEVAMITNSAGPGNILTLTLQYANVTEVFTGFGALGRAAEAVADTAVQACRRYLKATAPVGEYLTDQLMLPLALAGAGRFVSTGLTPHAETHVHLIRHFLDVPIAVSRREDGASVVQFG